MPAQATMTPLSVHQEGFGKTTSMEWFAPIWSNFFRIFWLDATPPATTRQVGETPSDSTHSKARETRSSRCVTAAVWNASAMAARVSRFSMPSQFSEGNTFCSGFDSSTTAPRCFSMANRTLVFNPAKLKSHVLRFRNGTVNLIGFFTFFRTIFSNTSSVMCASCSVSFLHCSRRGSKTISSYSLANFSNAGPPPPPTGKPRSRAVLSYASPMASSNV
mmetsp:Transcript_7517/g.24853  ORF Transcript_7517/g.24853 Transcript_7517/m.24853 type:complete len:218 (-) Transcript_7517:919-1572(-)